MALPSTHVHTCTGATIGDIYLQASESGSSWTTLWYKTGNLGRTWNSASITVSDYRFLRFLCAYMCPFSPFLMPVHIPLIPLSSSLYRLLSLLDVSSTSYTGDFALDAITVVSRTPSPTPQPTPEPTPKPTPGPSHPPSPQPTPAPSPQVRLLP